MRRTLFITISLLMFTISFDFCLYMIAFAEGIDFRGTFEYRYFESETFFKDSGQTINSDSYEFNQKYNFDMSRTLFPHLTFLCGTLYESNSLTATSEDIETDIDETVLRPYAELNLNNPLYSGSIGYRTTHIDEKITGTPETSNVQDQLYTIWNWKPVGLPELNLRYEQTETYDDPKTVDVTKKDFSLDTNYTLWDAVQLNYFYTHVDTFEELANSRSIEESHDGRVSYSDDFFDRRLYVSTSYTMRHDTFRLSGAGDAEIPILRNAGLSSLDNTPEDGPELGQNPALIDGNVIVSANINIGLEGDQVNDANIGLDFGFPVDIERIHVWVDRRLPGSISNVFQWDVYTSPDNTDTSDWTLIAVVGSVPFGTFDNRFEISFPQVNARFIKVVTRALASTDAPGAVDFPNLFVTEIQAFTVVSGASGTSKNVTEEHNYNINIRNRFSAKTTLGYDLNYRSREQDPASDKRTSFSNGIYLNHFFNDKFSGSTRFLRTDESEEDEDFTEYTYSAALRAQYLKTFGQTLTYSGRHLIEEDGSTTENTLFLRNQAKLYRGWGAFFDIGYSWDLPLNSYKRETSTFFRAGTDIEPNRKLTINLNYSLTEREDPKSNNGKTTNSEYSVKAFYLPFETVSLFCRINVLDREGTKTTLQNYSANWSPFPNSPLQFFFNFNETLRPEDDRKDRSMGPTIKWDINDYADLNIFYTISKGETAQSETDSSSVGADLRIFF